VAATELRLIWSARRSSVTWSVMLLLLSWCPVRV
jgi:hypothetical protein